MDQMTNKRAIDSIVKATDDNTKECNAYPDSYLYSIMLSHIDHLEANLYNFKFIARMVNPESIREIYLNLQILINDSSLVDNSKYYIKDQTRLSLVNSYKFEEKENANNSYRVDFSMSPNQNKENMYLLLELVNVASNTSSFININKEIFFKISIFLYQLLNYNIIDGDIFIKKINSFRLITGKESLLNILTNETKTFTLYWNHCYIICFLDPVVKNQIVYAWFSKEEYKELLQ